MGTGLGFEISQVKILQKNEGDEQGLDSTELPLPDPTPLLFPDQRVLLRGRGSIE